MNEFKENVKRYIKVHKELHGENFAHSSVAKDLFNSFNYDINKSLEEINSQVHQEYGLFLGRCQPFTNGHNAIIQQIIREGRKPIMLLGNEEVNEKNPLTFDERKEIIEIVYPNIIIEKIENMESWDRWFDNVISTVEGITNPERVFLYSHCKEIDKTDFEFCGIEYKNEHYTILFKEHNFNIVHIDEVQCSLGSTIHASDVRKDEEIAKRNLDARIYRHLKDNKNWYSNSRFN